MSPRARILVIVGAAAALAVGTTVALAVITANDEGGGRQKATPLEGSPPLVLDLGVRIDPEARALRKAEGLLKKRPAAAGEIFARYESPAAQIGVAIEIDGDDLPRAPVREPQTAVVPPRGLGHGQAGQ